VDGVARAASHVATGVMREGLRPVLRPIRMAVGALGDTFPSAEDMARQTRRRGRGIAVVTMLGLGLVTLGTRRLGRACVLRSRACVALVACDLLRPDMEHVHRRLARRLPDRRNESDRRPRRRPLGDRKRRKRPCDGDRDDEDGKCMPSLHGE
jgi:hypothetical protein